MLRYDLHTHSNHSPCGHSRVEALIRRAEKIGLSGIAITDHDTLEGGFAARSLATSLEIIPGCEVSLADGSHVIGLYLEEKIVGTDLERVISEVHAQGGLVLIPHPFRRESGVLANGRMPEMTDLSALLARVDLMEVFNPNCSPAENQNALRLVEQFDGSVIPTASSDAHQAWQVGIGQLLLGNSRVEAIAEKPGRLRSLLAAEGTHWNFLAGSDTEVLGVRDVRPRLVRAKQLLRRRFPRVARSWRRSRSAFRIAFHEPED